MLEEKGLSQEGTTSGRTHERVTEGKLKLNCPVWRASRCYEVMDDAKHALKEGPVVHADENIQTYLDSKESNTCLL